jgi:hypothetical protein
MKSEQLMYEEYIAEARKCDASRTAWFAPSVMDYTYNPPFKRRQTLTEVMGESFDYSKGPTYQELHQLLLNVAYGDVDCRPLAVALIDRMAREFAHYNAVEDDDE